MAVADSFFSSDMKDGRQVYAKVLKPVVKPFKGRNKAEYIPHLFVLCSGPMDHKKRDLANRTVRDWQLRLKKKKLKKGKCPPWYAPSSQNVERRTFLSRMTCDCEWQWNQHNLSSFDGCLDSAITSAYAAREKEWASFNSNHYFILYFLFFLITFTSIPLTGCRRLQ